MENKEMTKPIPMELEKIAPMELEDDALDHVSGGGTVNEAITGIPTYEPILYKK